MLKVLIRYADNTLDVAPIGPPSADTLLAASALAKQYSESFGVVRASVYNIPPGGGEVITVFVNGKVEESA